MTRMHEEVDVVISGQTCKIDKEIANLVKDLNDFTIKGRKPFKTYSSCQEAKELPESIGGHAIIEMEEFEKKAEDIDTMGKVLEDAGDRMFHSSKGRTIESGSNCVMSLCLRYNPRRQGYIPVLTIGCALSGQIRYGREIFEKRRKQAVNSIRQSLRKFSD